MATKKQATKGKKAAFRGFVTYAVGKEVKTAVKKLEESTRDVLVDFLDLVDDGCKIGLTWEDDRGCYFATAFRVDCERSDAGMILSARHASLHRCLATLLVANESIFPDGWPASGETADQYNW